VVPGVLDSLESMAVVLEGVYAGLAHTY
jgi:hypothetical protein